MSRIPPGTIYEDSDDYEYSINDSVGKYLDCGTKKCIQCDYFDLELCKCRRTIGDLDETN